MTDRGPRTAGSGLRRRSGAAAALILFAGAAAAETVRELPPPPKLDMPSRSELSEKGDDLTPAEWRALAAGRTVWYSDALGLWGREHYDPQADAVTFQFHTGECMEATWRHEGLLYCFDFHDGPPHCFRHLRLDGKLYVLGVQGAVQEVTKIDDTPVSCGPPPTS